MRCPSQSPNVENQFLYQKNKDKTTQNGTKNKKNVSK